MRENIRGVSVEGGGVMKQLGKSVGNHFECEAACKHLSSEAQSHLPADKFIKTIHWLLPVLRPVITLVRNYWKHKSSLGSGWVRAGEHGGGGGLHKY